MQAMPLKCPGYNVYQIQPPAADDQDEHPRLTVDGEPIHAGDTFEILLPSSWLWARIEMRDGIAGPGCWYIAEPAGLRDICPIGLFVRMSDPSRMPVSELKF